MAKAGKKDTSPDGDFVVPFLPEGDLGLPAAVKRLAQAWQISIQSAQAKIGGVLLSGRSIVAYARGRRTGREVAIIPDCWGTEWGPRWLESGVCKLPSEGGKVKITHERFDMFYEPESAAIFIRETDLQRLIDAKPGAEAQRAISGTSSWTPWRALRERAGAFEALRRHLHAGRILARHRGLYSQDGREYSGPGVIENERWADAREDPGTGRVMFTVPEKYQMFFDGDPAPPRRQLTEEVFPIGLELEAGAAEKLFPAMRRKSREIPKRRATRRGGSLTRPSA